MVLAAIADSNRTTGAIVGFAGRKYAGITHPLSVPEGTPRADREGGGRVPLRRVAVPDRRAAHHPMTSAPPSGPGLILHTVGGLCR